jgi:histone deacetylase 1/2
MRYYNASVRIGDGKQLDITAVGDLGFLKNVMICPDLKYNLISISQLDKDGFFTLFGNNSFKIFDADNKILCEGTLVNGLYVVSPAYISHLLPNHSSLITALPSESISYLLYYLKLWHRRLGHVNISKLMNMSIYGLVQGLPNFSKLRKIKFNWFCEICVLCKSKVTNKPKTSEYMYDDSHIHTLLESEIIYRDSSVIGQKWFLDVMGPFPVKSLGGNFYIVSAIDQFSRVILAQPIPQKKVAYTMLDMLIRFTKFYGLNIKVVKTDSGGEFISKLFGDIVESNNWLHEYTAPYSPHQNGVVERYNGTILNMMLCMLYEYNLPLILWGEALLYTIYILNRLPCAYLGNLSTPFSVLHGGIIPNVASARVFGSKAYSLIHEDLRNKFDLKMVIGHFIGISKDSKSWRFYNLTTHSITASRNLTCDETELVVNRNAIDHCELLKSFDAYSKQFIMVENSSLPPMNESTSVKHNLDHLVVPLSKLSKVDTELPKDNEIKTDVIDNTITTSDVNSVIKSVPIVSASDPPIDTENDVTSEIKSVSSPVPPTTRKSARPKGKLPSRYQLTSTVACFISSTGDPTSMKEAMESADSQHWKTAVLDEVNSWKQSGCIEVVRDLPEGAKSIGFIWVFNRKRDNNGVVVRYKARLCANGSNQVYGRDVFDVFSPVLRHTSLRVFLSLACSSRWVVEHLDVNTAFLNGPLAETVFMRCPKEFGYPVGSILKLVKSVYGLKQSSRNWYNTIHSFLLSIGFKSTLSDPCIYCRGTANDQVFIALYVDDILVAGSSQRHVDGVKALLCNRFDMKMLGAVRKFLGVEIMYDCINGVLSMSQSAYIKKILEKTSMLDCNPADVPIRHDIEYLPLDDNDDNPDSLLPTNTPYREIIGALLYLSEFTRPDIMFAVHKFATFAHKPSKHHWEGVKYLLRYLKNTMDVGIMFNGNLSSVNTVHAFCDADWGSNKINRRSQTGYIILFNGGPVSFTSVCQKTVARSSSESEYMSIAALIQEVLWIRSLLMELGFPQLNPTVCYSDNKGAIDLCYNDAYSKRTKHIDIAYYFVREQVQEFHNVLIKHVPTVDQQADPLTKAVTSNINYHLWKRIMIGTFFRNNLKITTSDKNIKSSTRYV